MVWHSKAFIKKKLHRKNYRVNTTLLYILHIYVTTSLL